MDQLLAWFAALADSELFLSALGGGLGGGIIGGLMTLIQTRYVFRKERIEAQREREAQREEQALVELLSVLNTVKNGIRSYRHPNHYHPVNKELRDEADDRLTKGVEVSLPRIADPSTRDRFLKLRILITEFKAVKLPERKDSHGNDKEAHPEHRQRMEADLAEWIDYVRETVEARLDNTAPPSAADVLPVIEAVEAKPWVRPGKPTQKNRLYRRRSLRGTTTNGS